MTESTTTTHAPMTIASNKRGLYILAAIAALFMIMAVSTLKKVAGGDDIDVVIATATEDARYAENFNKHLSSVSMSKDDDEGKLMISFKMNEDVLRCPGCSFLVRLFDKNGEYITHFTSEPFYQMFRADGQWVELPSPIELTYNINTRDLKEVRKAEFGISPR